MHHLVLRVSVKTPLKRAILLRGTLLASLGMLLLISAAAWVPESILKYWGLPIVIAGGALVTIGLLPYRKLVRMENKPNELILNENSSIQWIERGRPCFTIPCASIAKTEFLENKSDYGIGIWLKHPLPEKIIIHRIGSNLSRWSHKECDIFLPYLTERAFKEMKEFQSEINECD